MNKNAKTKYEFKKSDKEFAAFLANALTYACLADSTLKRLHEKLIPRSATGDYSDVKVITPDGEFAWNDVQHVSESDMALIRREIANCVFTFLRMGEVGHFLTALERQAKPVINEWEQPVLRPEMVEGGLPQVATL